MKYPESESNVLEFKSELPSNDQIVKTIIGFCNQFGGRLIIGVSDEREVLGLNPDDIPDLTDRISDSIYKSTTPSIVPLIYTQSLGGQILLVIEVSRGMQCPYFITSKGAQKGTYIRLGASTVRAKEDMLFDLQWQARGRTVDETPVCHADLSVLKHQDIIRCLSKRFTSQSKLNVTQLKALGLLYEENQQIWPNVAGVLLFSQYPQHYKSEAMVICTRFKGISGREILASQDCEGSLFEQIELAFHFVSTQLNISSSIRGLKRDDVMEMPMIALREGIVNAVVHRHYGIASPIKIAVYDNRVEIFSPGCFPGPINQKQIELGVTYVRNRIIVNLMREAGAVEKLGSGLMTIFSSFEKAGLAEPELKEGEAFVKLVLPRYNIQKSVTAAERIVDIISKEGPKSISELLERFSESKSTVTRRVNELIHSNRLKKIGNTRNTVYSVVDE